MDKRAATKVFRDALIAIGAVSSPLLSAILFAETLRQKGINAQVLRRLSITNDGGLTKRVVYMVDYDGTDCDVADETSGDRQPAEPLDRRQWLSYDYYTKNGFRLWYANWKNVVDESDRAYLPLFARHFD
jgi:hypothetical protein